MAKHNSAIINGTVNFLGTNTDGERNKTICMLEITAEQADKITGALKLKDIDDGIAYNPIKMGEGDNEGKWFFKASTTFDFKVKYDGEFITGKEAKELLETVGKGSTVSIFVDVKEVKYRRTVSQVAYLKAIEIIELEEFEEFDPFEDGAELARL